MAAKVLNKPRKRSKNGQLAGPAWDIALLYPTQGHWDVCDYLDLGGNRLVEFSDGAIEVLPMPTTSHQLSVLFLCRMLGDFASVGNLGLVAPAGVRVQLWPEKFRAPDVVFMLAKNLKRAGEEFWDGADLVMEIVSGGPSDRRRDLKIKPVEYARAGIAEYWLIDPQRKTITVLSLKGKSTKCMASSRSELRPRRGCCPASPWT